MFATFLIGLREALEAALVVSILVAFLVKSDRREHLRLVWIGVAVAVALSAAAGALLEFTAAHLSYRSQELFDAVASLIAVAFVTWMIFWMRSASRRIAGELREQLDKAIAIGPVAVITVAFLAVAREGLETSIFLYSASRSAGSGLNLLLSALAGIAVAVVIGVALYLGAVRINLSRFFTWTGALLIVVAAGILKYAVYDFQEAGVLGGLQNHAFDISGALPPDSWYAELLRGTINLTPRPTVLETIAWAAYAVPVLALFLWPTRSTRKTADSTVPEAASEAQAR
ncbi:MAG: iron uptake transporter permease EfeU [Stackebrandtia sp.]